MGTFTSFDWDVIAHEYGHVVAYLQGAIRAEGGFHDGNNQYDIEKNPSGEALNTYRNKELSNVLALNEAYATWFALNFWKERRYSNETPWLGDHQLDQTYHADRPGIPMDLESNTKSYGPIKNIFGEDSEISVGRLLWDITDENNEPNQRALCEQYCQDAITVPFASVSASAIYPGGARGTAPLSSISDFHEHFYKSYVGKPVGDLDKEGPVNPQELERAFQVGALFAEHGMAAIRTCSKSVRGCEKRGLGRSAALQILAGPQGPSAVCALQPIPIRTFAPHGQTLNRFSAKPIARMRSRSWTSP